MQFCYDEKNRSKVKERKENQCLKIYEVENQS